MKHFDCVFSVPTIKMLWPTTTELEITIEYEWNETLDYILFLICR